MSSNTESTRLSILIATVLELSKQFQNTLSSSSSPPSADSNSNPAVTQDALSLLSASSTALKSQTTKLSLLSITAPFTSSAVCTVLSALSSSVLPSLLTAALLVTPNAYTKAFHDEIWNLSKAALKELSVLIEDVRAVAEKKGKNDHAAVASKEGKQGNKDQGKEAELSQSEKDFITTATGRVWDVCDTLIDVSGKGVVGFVVRRVEEWRDLVRDAVEEIEEWDPEEEGDEFFDDLLGDGGDGEDAQDSDADGDASQENEDEHAEQRKADVAMLQEHKKSTIRFLKPIAQIFPAIVSNRLQKVAGSSSVSSSPSRVAKLESLMSNLQNVPNHIDEVAGALYEAKVETSVRYLEKARNCATAAMDVVALPLDAEDTGGGQVKSEDKFTVWSKTWSKVIDEVGTSLNDAAKKGSMS